MRQEGALEVPVCPGVHTYTCREYISDSYGIKHSQHHENKSTVKPWHERLVTATIFSYVAVAIGQKCIGLYDRYRKGESSRKGFHLCKVHTAFMESMHVKLSSIQCMSDLMGK